jgi:hypothetical protein
MLYKGVQIPISMYGLYKAQLGAVVGMFRWANINVNMFLCAVPNIFKTSRINNLTYKTTNPVNSQSNVLLLRASYYLNSFLSMLMRHIWGVQA